MNHLSVTILEKNFTIDVTLTYITVKILHHNSL